MDCESPVHAVCYASNCAVFLRVLGIAGTFSEYKKMHECLPVIATSRT